MKTYYVYASISLNSSCNNVSDKSRRENQRCRSGNNMEQYGTARDQRPHGACALHAGYLGLHSEYVTVIAFPRQQ